jgi:hypothetical protein
MAIKETLSVLTGGAGVGKRAWKDWIARSYRTCWSQSIRDLQPIHRLSAGSVCRHGCSVINIDVKHFLVYTAKDFSYLRDIINNFNKR